MNYEQKYKDALERAKTLYENANGMILKRWVEQVFPEFKESNDEKIRKELIEFVHQYGDNYYGQISKASAISWLEKQGEKSNSVYDEKLSEILGSVMRRYINDPSIPYTEREKVSMEIIPYVERLEKQGAKEVDPRYENLEELLVADNIYQMSMNEAMDEEAKLKAINALSELEIGKLLGLDKQGEQESLCDKCRKAQPSQSCQDITELGRCYLEHEQSSDKIEPNFNFKVGQWIVAAGKCVYLITKIEGFNVTLVDTNGDECVFDAGSLDDAHLWTINDAKEGDVLAIGNEYFLFKEKRENTSPVVYISHCFANSAGAFRVTNGRDCGEFLSIENGIKACPATKEQRDILFQEMNIAGYEWDSEKRELRKIEPKFKVGDFIVSDYCMGKVIELTDDAYLLETGQGIPFSCEHNAHLWTIQDAKNGDVLATNNDDICIFDGTVEEGKYPFAYCGVTARGFDFYDGKLPFTHANVQPATKEQRDLLFQKMKDAGYEWDSEKRELRKIEHEQNPADKSEVKFKGGDWIVDDKGNTAYITKVGSDLYGTLRYYIEWTDGYKSDPMPCFVDNDFHLWTIKDAKDGDILICNDSIFIFNEIYKNYLIYYGICKHNTLHNEFYDDKYYSFLDLNTIDINNIHPSTKEQRDTLMKAMTDAEYTFDFNKKELKKITK